MSHPSIRAGYRSPAARLQHEIVPCPLIENIARLRGGGTKKILAQLLKHKLLHHENVKYDGFRLTNLGYDYLAIKTFVNRGLIVGLGRQIGVGKESDIFEVLTEDNETLCLKLHRLGRTSFRDVKTKRDYLGHRKSYGSWLYLSRLAALKEFAFMRALDENDFPVPRPVDVNRHAVLMGKVNAHPMVNVRSISNPGKVYDFCMSQILRLAQHGLIHGDFNEFNLMISDDEEVTIIDFPQMVSIQHANAKYYFDRDVDCIRVYFEKKFRFVVDEEEDTAPRFSDLDMTDDASSLDKRVAASGFDSKRKAEFERLSVALNAVDEEEDEDGDEDEEGAGGDAGDAIEGRGGRGVEAGSQSGSEPTDLVGTVGQMNLSDSAEGSGGDGSDSEKADDGADDDDEIDASEEDGGARHRRSGRKAGRTSVQERVAKQQQTSKAKAKTSNAFRGRNTNKSRNAGKRKGDKMKASLDF